MKVNQCELLGVILKELSRQGVELITRSAFARIVEATNLIIESVEEEEQ